jgi:hypothetical protein
VGAGVIDFDVEIRHCQIDCERNEQTDLVTAVGELACGLELTDPRPATVDRRDHSRHKHLRHSARSWSNVGP